MHTMTSDQRKTVFITGTSSGFGMLTAIQLATEGYHIIATMRDLSKKELLLSQAELYHVTQNITILALDITDEVSIKEAVQQALSIYQRIDILINNAGYAQGGFVEEVNLTSWKEQLDTNVIGTIMVTRAVLPYMRQQAEGMIINISSISGVIAFPGYAPYATSKFAIEGFSEALRLEMKPFGVKVTLVEPGAYATQIWQKGFQSIVTNENSPYQTYLHSIMDFSSRSADQGQNPLEIALLISKIIKQKHVKLRYVIGKGTPLLAIAKRLLPWTILERIILKTLSKPLSKK